MLMTKPLITLLFSSTLLSAASVQPAYTVSCEGIMLDSFEYKSCGEPATPWNYGRMFSDAVIRSTDPEGSIEVTAIPALAGAVASIKYYGQELIATGAHGSSFGYVLHPYYPSENFPISECDNPTEVGSKGDDSIDLAKNGLLGAPWLGHSSTAIMSYWSGMAGSVPQIATQTNLANFLLPSDTSEFNNESCARYSVANGGHVGNVNSFFILQKWMTLGMTVNGKYHHNILAFDSLVQVPHDVEQLDVSLVGYLTRRLNTEILYDPLSNKRYVRSTGESRSAPPFQYNSRAPVVRIFSDAAWGTAIGVIVSPFLLSKENIFPRTYTLTNEDFPPNPNYTYIYRNIAAQQNYQNLKAGDKVEGHAYFVIGSVSEIEAISVEFCKQWGPCIYKNL